MFQPVQTNVSFPSLETDILEWWQQHQIVAKSLLAGDRPFVFYEGPPTANGQPGFHHIISRSFKDIILRYRAMQGYRIIGRREGWDTHGLPVEIEVEKELGFSGKPDIERYGIAEFNQRCRESVWRYIQEWKVFSNRIAYWLSEDAYITYENHYIESLWWIFRQLWDKGLLFRDYKVTMHCPRCGTSLSDHEVSQGFKEDVDDPSVWVRFRLQAPTAPDAPAHPLAAELAGHSLLAWTTTPWTLPANVALCVNPTATYALVTLPDSDDTLLLAADLVTQVLGEQATVQRTYQGQDLVGLTYESLFQGVAAPGETIDWSTTYRVIADDFVSLEDGTGVVHIAPAYGDLEIGRRYGLPTLFSVDLNGNVLPNFADQGFGGLFFKKADPHITRNLRERGLLFKGARVRHSYPFCWRCDTPLLYYAKPSWYIRTTAFKQQLIANNQRIYWVPEHIRDGRFGNWLENNIDWAVSRERYWGTPLPVWVSDDAAHMECIGSLAELEQKVGRSLADLDLHRPYVDELTWPAPDGHGTMRRIPDVADCWFDSGAMQVAQWHYPFENQEQFAAAHPADYICEAVDQTRGWFYTLHALGTLLFQRPAFEHVICLGHILDAEGQKMSKSRGNVVNPWDIFNQYGVDALRWYLFSSSPPGNPRRFSASLVEESLRQFLLTLWNTYSFFVTYANLDSNSIDLSAWLAEDETTRQRLLASITNPIDRWALGWLNQVVQRVTASMEAYDVVTAARLIERFVDDLSNWYVRRNRRRFWKSEADSDKQSAYYTLYTCLVTVTRLAAPFVPFITESIYQNLVVEAAQQAGVDPATVAESVHLARWPQTQTSLIDTQLIADTDVLLRVISLGRAARKQSGVKVRQPLSEVWVRTAQPAEVEGIKRFESELADELNIKTVRYLDAAAELVTYRCKPNLRLLGKKYGKLVPALNETLRNLSEEQSRQVAHAVEAGQPVHLEVAGQTMELFPDEVLIETTSPEGYAVAEHDGTLVALNITLTPELRLEGAARDLVRNVQDSRKNAGLEISDRIVLYLHGTGDDAATMLDEIIATWGQYVQAETLATDLVHGAAPANAYTEQMQLDEQPIGLGIVKQEA
ncbi:MAG: isoleucine--tRNA ligase [Chloroflexaceae bacterium]|nr:isoleucine--tRNA ligase [Chloroflexaceae bacterium]